MKNTIKIILLFTTIIVAIIVSMIIVAGPKDMKTLISFENIEKIEYEDYYGEVQIQLTNEEMGKFLNRIYRSKIKRRYVLIKQGNSIKYTITYKDKSSVTFGNIFISYKDKYGKAKKGFQYKLYWDGKYVENNEWPE